MQRHFRPEDFDTWSKKLAQLRPGMSYKQALRALQPKEVAARTESTQTYVDVVRLDDAYVTLIALDEHERLLWTASPVAITYHVQPEPKKRPKT
jgi:hypothetical protein